MQKQDKKISVNLRELAVKNFLPRIDANKRKLEELISG